MYIRKCSLFSSVLEKLSILVQKNASIVEAADIFTWIVHHRGCEANKIQKPTKRIRRWSTTSIQCISIVIIVLKDVFISNIRSSPVTRPLAPTTVTSYIYWICTRVRFWEDYTSYQLPGVHIK